MTHARATLLTMMKDEGPYLLEWLAHHRVLGFDRVVVLHNDCTDGTDALLARLQEMGEVTAIAHSVTPGKKPQPSALRLAETLPEIQRTDWLLVADSDEFLDIGAGSGRIEDLLSAVPSDTQAIAATWRIMGSNGLTAWYPGPVCESYTRGAPDDFRKGWGVKTLFRPFPQMKLGIHRPTVKGAARDPDRRAQLESQNWVNGAGKPLTRRFKREAWQSSTHTVGYGLVEMKHFATRSTENFLLRAARGNVNDKAGKYDAAHFAVFDRNETAQAGLTNYSEQVRERLADWLEDPILAQLHRRTVATHAARLEALRSAPGFDDRLAELEAVRDTPLDRLDEVLHIQPLPREGRAQIERMLRDGFSARFIAESLARDPRPAARVAAIDAEDAAEYAAMGLVPRGRA